MNEEYRRQLAEYVAEFRLPRYRELPDIGLHLEQVTRYASRYVPSQLTGSMVSNYVKQKLIPGPVKKCYFQESIAYLIFLSYIKTVIPLEDIRLMMEVQKSSYDLRVAYDYFCDELENLLQYVCGLRETPAVIGSSRSQEKELLRTALLSITYKIYLDQYLRLIREEQNS
ncbi:MAG: DUF1836 domain-containing protein [Candidatus Faecousia sp.]|nr:DUF1836 domain-containing protein [Candidatus Faecousia sp.]